MPRRCGSGERYEEMARELKGMKDAFLAGAG